ncbi:GIY-YIG nuclease family protein [Streptomyces sp. NPDC127168]|uniref:GIY-YIG nuclease family protein n=1 Tax=unclassified Streptomyces TaxID=2593676 RepID=UPI003632EC95
MSVSEIVPISVLPAAETNGRSAVYRIFGDDQRLLYIGSSERPRQRWHEHRNRTDWWPQARAYSLTWLASRDSAFKAEQKAIVTERPVFNFVWQCREAPAPRQLDSEEVRRVADALEAVERIEDREERVRAKSQIMAAQVARNKEWAAERNELIRELWDGGNGLSYRKIADRLGIKLATVQDAFRDYKGSGTHRPRAPKKSEE